MFSFDGESCELPRGFPKTKGKPFYSCGKRRASVTVRLFALTPISGNHRQNISRWYDFAENNAPRESLGEELLRGLKEGLAGVIGDQFGDACESYSFSTFK